MKNLCVSCVGRFLLISIIFKNIDLFILGRNCFFVVNVGNCFGKRIIWLIISGFIVEIGFLFVMYV